MFKRAEKKKSFLRMSIAGPSGSGKTWTALTFATALSPSGKIAVVDTEHGSASKYADSFTFDALELSNFHPDNYVKAIRAAVAGGYEVIILDSITHAWSGKGGILDIVGGNFSKWKEANPIEQAFIEAIISSPIHVIATMRAKTQYEVEKNERTGKPEPKKVGMGAIQRDGIEYEFDIATMMDLQNTITVEKTRCPAIRGAQVPRPDGDFMTPIIAWLNGGGAPAKQPASKSAAASTNGNARHGDNGLPFALNPTAAFAWAVEIGASENVDAAKNDFKWLVDTGFDGKFTKRNAEEVFAAWFIDRMEKLSEVESQPEPTVDMETVAEQPF